MKIRWWVTAAALSGALGAQELRLAFSDPDRPGKVKIEILTGSVRVAGVAGKDVVVGPLRGKSERPTREGMRQVDLYGLETAMEADNLVTLAGGVKRASNIDVQIPARSALVVRCTNCGSIDLDSVAGDIDVNSMNSRIQVRNAIGSVLAHSFNHNVSVSFDQVDPSKAMSLSSFNGNVDVTFPADLKATVRLRTENGKIQSEFDLKLSGGIRTDRGLVATINGGGPEIQLKTFNGSIFLRKKK
jgi:DUF4097 and DUF4098 domain-containing protein YvlB